MRKVEITEEDGSKTTTWELSKEEVEKAIKDFIESEENESCFYSGTTDITLFEATGRMCEGDRPVTFTKAIAKTEEQEDC